MKIRIEHQIPGRLRIRVPGRILDGDARALEACLCEHPNILSCTVYGRSGSVAVEYRSGNGFSKRQVLELLRSLGKDELARYRLDPTIDLPLHAPRLFESTAWMCLSFVATRFLLPYPLRVIFSLVRLAAFLIRGWRSLLRLRLDVAVLDAAALASCAAARDFATLSSSAFLIRLSELVEEHTQHSVEQELIFSLLRIHDKVALLATADVEDERLVDARDLREGDLIVVRTGQALPVDGVVLSGEAWVNQQALTGEARAVLRECGDTVFAGTALEDGELIVRVLAVPENTRLRSIIGLVQQSESQKSISQLRMERLANRIVPFNLLFALVVYAFSRDLSKLVAALTVDYSCALRLTGSVAALAAMREASALGLRVKGSRAFEAVASADTIIFDKTGTLTEASPSVSEVIALNDWSVTEILRLAACLEEHFPHPVARAIVAEAACRGINHRERHAEVAYIVAHGIASTLDGRRVIIGSGHFVFDDEGVCRDEQLLERLHEDHPASSPLFLAVEDELVGVLLINDPLRPGIVNTLKQLRALGFRRIVMLTGDNQATAARIAEEAGIDEFYADLLPEDKRCFVEECRADGATVLMVGDGVNDSPALSSADAGIAMQTGAAIAREVADVTLTDGRLEALVALRRLSERLKTRTDGGYGVSIAINTALLLLGTAGFLAPGTVALAHNATTVALCANGTRAYLASGEPKQ